MTATAVKLPSGWAVVVARRGAPGRVISDRLTKASAIEMADAYNDPMEAKRKDRYRRNPAKKNPSGSTWLLLGVGAAALGIGAYFLLRPSTPSTSSTDTTKALPAGLPAGADINAGTTAVKLMLLGHQAEVNPARSWLSQFQSSVGLPATGAMDPATRAMLNKATPLAANLPTPTILG